MRKLIILAQVIFASLLYAQTSAVSGTMVDSDGITWAGASWTLSFVPSAQQPNINKYTINGSPLNPTVINQTGTSDGSGAFSFSTYQIGAINPVGAQFMFTLCPKASVSCSTLLFSTGSNSSLSLTTSVESNFPAPRFIATPGTYGYDDVEAQVQLVIANTYFNTTSNSCRVYTGSAWTNCSTISSALSVIAGTNISISEGSPCTSGNCTINSTGGGGGNTECFLGSAGLVGTFTDSSGIIKGNPLCIGKGPVSFTTPSGATQLQLGINDNEFADDTGSFVINVQKNTGSPNPVTIIATSMPWSPTSNPSFNYGLNDGTSPTVAINSLSNGDSITLTYVSGTVKVSPGAPAVDANGWLTVPPGPACNGGPTGQTNCGGLGLAPTYYMGSSGSFTPNGDLAGNSSLQEVVGIHFIPLCNGFSPSNNQLIQYTTSSSPNPCWTAATGGSGSGTVSGQTNGVLPLATGPTTIGASSHIDELTSGQDTVNQKLAINDSADPSAWYLTPNSNPCVIQAGTFGWCPSDSLSSASILQGPDAPGSGDQIIYVTNSAGVMKMKFITLGSNCTLTSGTLNCTGGGSGGNYVNLGSTVTWTGCTFSGDHCSLGSNQSTVNISSIPNTYSILHIAINGAWTSSGCPTGTVDIQFNGDTTSGNYLWFFGPGGSSSSSDTHLSASLLSKATPLGGGTFDIQNANSTLVGKLVTGNGWFDGTMYITGGRWTNTTNAITSLLFENNTSCLYAAGTQIWIYGSN